MDSNQTCPCGSGNTYSTCCQPLIDNRAQAQSPEQLMRSRYTAYILRDLPYIRKTWHHDHCPRDLSLEGLPDFIRLQIISHEMSDKQGQVHFRAFYHDQGELTWLEERSDFVKLSERWFYTTGRVE